jgi:hypothetical protein
MFCIIWLEAQRVLPHLNGSIQQPTDNSAVIFKSSIYDIYCIYCVVRCVKLAYPFSDGMEWSEIYSTIKSIHSCTVHYDRQHLET